MICALWSVLYALCFMRYTLCFMLYTLCSILYALCSKLCFMLYALCSVLCAHTRPHMPKPSSKKNFTSFLLTTFCGGFLDKKILRLFMALLTIFCVGFLDDFFRLCWQFSTAFFVLLSMQYKFWLRSTKVWLPFLGGGCKSLS